MYIMLFKSYLKIGGHSLYQFPAAIVTNYHNLTDCKQPKFILL